eukprot:747189-Prorocentrum_minimum.AAC.1
MARYNAECTLDKADNPVKRINVTSVYGSSCANNGKDALNTPEVTHVDVAEADGERGDVHLGGERLQLGDLALQKRAHAPHPTRSQTPQTPSRPPLDPLALDPL